MTMQRHREIGSRLYRLNEELTHLAVEVSNAEGVVSPVARRFDRLLSALLGLRSEMENAMFRRYPQDGDVRVYFPGQEANNG